MHVSDFRPIANLRLLYKVFAYLILRRIEHTLDTHQPEDQHRFRSKHRLEEHLLFFFPAPFWTAEVSGSWTVLLGSLQAWTNTGGHFYPGGPGIAREMAKSKPELLICWLGGGWGLEGGPGLRPGVGSRLGHCLRHW